MSNDEEQGVEGSAPEQEADASAPEQEADASGAAEPQPGQKRRPPTARERAELKRAEKLEQVREQVESGSLVIRKMTDDERRRYPPPGS